MAKMEMERALSRLKLGPKKDPCEMLEFVAIECRYSLELYDSRKKSRVLNLGGLLYSRVMMAMGMIYRKSNKNRLARRYKEMHMQWSLSGRKMSASRYASMPYSSSHSPSSVTMSTPDECPPTTGGPFVLFIRGASPTSSPRASRP